MSPTARSLELLRRAGYTAVVVEHRPAHARSHTTRDLLGFIDILALGAGETLAVQTTDATNVAHRVVKIEASPHLDAVRAAGWRVLVHGWRPADYAGDLPALRVVELTESSTEIEQ